MRRGRVICRSLRRWAAALPVLTVAIPCPCLRAADDPEALVAGVSVAREVAAGEAQTFTVMVDRGSLIDVLVEPQGLDVAATLREPDGHEALTADQSINPMYVERVLWIARATGAHSLTVKANVTRPSGRYVITLAVPRPALPEDERRVAAQRDLETVVAWRHAGTFGRPDVAPEALRRLQAAVDGFHATGDRRGEATALGERAELELELNRRRDAVATATRALALDRDIGDRRLEAWAHQQVGWASFLQGEVAVGLEHLMDAVRMSRESGNGSAESTYLNDVGTVYRRTGRAEQSIVFYQQAIEKAHAWGNRELEGFALNNLGIACKDLGEYDRALASYELAAAIARERKDDGSEAGVYNNIGIVYRMMGDDAHARDSFGRYLAQARARDPGGGTEARALNNLSGVSFRLGEYAEALDQARRSLEIRRKTADRSGQGSSLENIGRALNGMGQREDALAALRESLAIRRELGERYAEADTLMDVAVVLRDRGELTGAREQAEAAVALTEELRAAVTSPELRASFVAVQQDKYDVYVDILMRLHEQARSGGYDAAALQASERAKARVLLDSLVEARADIRQGVDPALLDRERALQKTMGDAAARLARALPAGAESGAVTAARQELEAAGQEYRQLEARVRQESPRYAALTQPAPATLDELRRELLDDDTVLLEFHLGDERSFLWAATRSELQSFSLPARADIERGARSIHDLLARRERPHSAAEVGASDRRLRAASAALSRVLLGPLSGRLRGDWKGRRLVVVTPGALAYVPLGALPDPSGSSGLPLLRSHEIVFAPSASVLLAIRQEPDRPRSPVASVAVLGDPVFEASDPRVRHQRGARAPAESSSTGLTRALDSFGKTGFARLPFSRREATEIGSLAPGASLLKATDFDASRALVAQGALDRHRLVHFATHGLLDSQHPDLSGLVLSLVDENGAPQDGFLRMPDIYNMKLSADLVVLSACQTALGREMRGEGLIGLTRGFMYAGAKAVVASLWQVDDESTAELMKRFYRGMLKEHRRPADALRRSQLEMSQTKRWSAPFYWAGFVLQGEWK